MSNCPYLDRAIYYRVENVPGASSVGSRFANILEQLQKTGELSKTILNMLAREGFIALSRLGAKEISYTDYLILVEQERRARKAHYNTRQSKTLSQPYLTFENKFTSACEGVTTHPNPTKEVPMRTNYVLIDFENVQPESLAALQQDHFKVLIFVGANQAKVPFEVASALQSLGSRAEYIKISGNGANALDFHIAYYIGQLSAKDPTGYFHIISKDTGFDPLIAHLKSKNISAARETDIGEIPLVKATPVPPPPPPSPKPPHKPDSYLPTIVEKLRPTKATKPRTVKSLTSHIKATFPKAITETEISNLIADMERRHLITVTDNKIAYHL